MSTSLAVVVRPVACDPKTTARRSEAPAHPATSFSSNTASTTKNTSTRVFRPHLPTLRKISSDVAHSGDVSVRCAAGPVEVLASSIVARPTKLTTPRLVLRTWRAGDLEALAAMSADVGVMRFLGGAMSRADTDAMLARITTPWESRGFGVWAVEHADRLIGFAGIVVPRWEAKFTPCVEIMWRFVSSAWGNGFATRQAWKP